MPNSPWGVIVIWSKEGTICGRFVDLWAKAKRATKAKRVVKAKSDRVLFRNKENIQSRVFLRRNHGEGDHECQSQSRTVLSFAQLALDQTTKTPAGSQILGRPQIVYPLFLCLGQESAYRCQTPDALLFENQGGGAIEIVALTTRNMNDLWTICGRFSYFDWTNETTREQENTRIKRRDD
jgi:hypothetical protein